MGAGDVDLVDGALAGDGGHPVPAVHAAIGGGAADVQVVGIEFLGVQRRVAVLVHDVVILVGDEVRAGLLVRVLGGEAGSEHARALRQRHAHIRAPGHRGGEAQLLAVGKQQVLALRGLVVAHLERAADRQRRLAVVGQQNAAAVRTGPVAGVLAANNGQLALGVSAAAV